MIATPAYKKFRKSLDARLAEYIRTLIPAITSQTNVEYVQAGTRYLDKLVTGSGKRVRGYVLAHMYKTAGGEDEVAAREAAVAVELFHLFALIHDDVMDKASARRGIPTLHCFTEDWLTTAGRRGDLAHVGVSQAILWGDLLLAISQSRLQACSFSYAPLRHTLSIFSRMFSEVVVGQMIDVDMTTRTSVTQAELEEKTILKSALYSFVRPMQMGVALAEGDPTLMKFCEIYGTALGMAFQIQDDLFDLTTQETTSAKPVLNDIKAGEHTFFTNYIWEQGSTDQKKKLTSVFGHSLTERQEEEVRKLFVDSGAVAYGEDLLNKYFAEAEQSLELIPKKYRKDWGSLITLIKNRTS